MEALWRATRRKGIERRAQPRIPLAVPVRYATDQGYAGVGVLIDVHERGAGLLVPTITPEAFHVWVQFLWFNDRMGVQGRIAFVRETPDGFHVGIQLHPLPHESARFVTGFLMPYGLRKFTYDRRHPAAFLRTLFPKQHQMRDQRRRRYLPVMVEQGPMKVWAVTEDRTATGAILLLPHSPKERSPVKIKTWGTLEAQHATVVRSEPVDLPPAVLYRVSILFEAGSVERKDQTVAAPVSAS